MARAGPIPPDIQPLLTPAQTQLWDSSISLECNYKRIVFDPKKPILPDNSSIPTIEELWTQGTGYKDVQGVFNQFRSIDGNLSPLKILQKQIEVLFSQGDFIATIILPPLLFTVENGSTQVHFSKVQQHVELAHENIGLWNNASATIARKVPLVFACSPNAIYSEIFGGTVTLNEIQTGTSASLAPVYEKAKTVALAPDGKMTVINIQLADEKVLEFEKQIQVSDEEIIELRNRERSNDYTSFRHCFVLAVGAQGVIIWQAWGAPAHDEVSEPVGYTLNEYLARGGGGIRNWKEADEFVLNFQKFVDRKGIWDFKNNKWFKQCFEVDLRKIAALQNRRIVPGIKPFVKLHVLEDVKREDLLKFEWVDSN